jgi:hypothetical protein
MKNGNAVNLYKDELVGNSLTMMSEGIEEGAKLLRKVLEEIMGFLNGKGLLRELVNESNNKERKRERSRVKMEERDNVFSLFVVFNNFINEMVYDIAGKI